MQQENIRPWQPVAPSHLVRPAHNIVAAFMPGQELALWRSRAGSVQAWENRCPHRGTRFTLGRIIDDRLSCAYHGWQFEPDGGKCAVIPAHPAAPAPRNLCARSFATAEVAGMVWVCEQGGSAPPNAAAVPAAPFFCRSLGLRAGASAVAEGLRANGYASEDGCTWRGSDAAAAAVAYLNEASDELSFLNLWHGTAPAEAELARLLAAARRLRESIENPTIPRSAA